MRVFRAFLVSFLSLFGVFLLYFNFCLATSTEPFPTLFVPNSLNNWNNNYYFGFMSIMNIIDDIPTTLTLSNFNHNLDLFEGSLGGLSSTFENFGEWVNTGNMLSLVFGIFSVLTAPIQAIFYFLLINIIMFEQLIEIINLIFKLVSGYYNINIADTWSFGLDELPDGYYYDVIYTNTGYTTTLVPVP